MKNLMYVWGVILVGLASCTKPNPDPLAGAPQIDFSSKKYFKPSEIRASRFNIPCNEDAYWEGKKINLQGYVFRGDIDTVARF